MEPQHPQHRAIEKHALDFAGHEGGELERRETGGNPADAADVLTTEDTAKRSPFPPPEPTTGGAPVCLNREGVNQMIATVSSARKVSIGCVVAQQLRIARRVPITPPGGMAWPRERTDLKR